MNKTLFTAIVVVIVIVAGLVVVALNYDIATTPNSTTTPESSSREVTPANIATDSDVKLIITYTNDGFDNSMYTVGKGQNILVKNNSDRTLEFSSDEHPTHKDNPELNMRELNPDEEATFSVSSAGTWKFHDHLDSSKTGTLVVTN